MSYAAYKMMHYPTGIENCASGFITHSIADSTPQFIPPIPSDDLDSDFPKSHGIGPIPNLVISSGNVVEVYVIRILDANAVSDAKRGGVMTGVSGASLELVCHYRFVFSLTFFFFLLFFFISIWKRMLFFKL